VLPSVDELLDGALQFRIPLRVQFRGTTVREGLLLDGPVGWGEFAPFPEYGPQESGRWLAAAVEAAWLGWPDPVRASVPVNAIVPAVPPDVAAQLVAEAECSTVKVKVGESGQSLRDDVARVAAVREALGPAGKLRVDANGAWSVEQATDALRELEQFALEYVEQPCASLEDCAQLRRVVAVPIAVDEGLRKAADSLQVRDLRDAADVLILKVPPLGGVRPALAVAEVYGLPCVVSSALDTSVGLSAGVALAAALPQLPYACGLGSGLLLTDDATTNLVRPDHGSLAVRMTPPPPDRWRCTPPSPTWIERLTLAYQARYDACATQPGIGASGPGPVP